MSDTTLENTKTLNTEVHLESALGKVRESSDGVCNQALSLGKKSGCQQSVMPGQLGNSGEIFVQTTVSGLVQELVHLPVLVTHTCQALSWQS